jgi:hypothetical protein
VSGTGESGLTRALNTYRTSFIAAIVAAVGVLCLYISGIVSFAKHYPTWQVVVSQLGGLLVVTGGISILWDLKGRRDFADEVLAKAQVAADIRSSGLRRLSMQWLEDVEWANMFHSAREIDVFLSYGTSWRNLHYARLQEFGRVGHNKLRVYLPHPGDTETVSVLAQRYDSTSERIVQQISDAAKAFADLRADGGADIRVYYRRGDPTFACYRFDGQIVVTLYSHRRSRGDVPTMLIGPGTLYDFFATELAAIRAQSEEQPSTEISEGNT